MPWTERWDPRPGTVRLVTPIQRGVYRASGGRLFTRARGKRLLLLTTRGRRSGLRRTVPLPYFPDGERIVLVASNAVQEENPAWFRNLEADPHVEIQIGPRHGSARAHAADGDDAARLWALLDREADWYRGYQSRVDREIPLVVVVPDQPIGHGTPVDVERPALGWWVSILSGMGLLGLIAHLDRVWRLWSRRVTPTVPRPVYQVVFWIAVGLHVGEGTAAVGIAERNGRATSSLRWGFQTLLLGFPSLRLLRRQVARSA